MIRDKALWEQFEAEWQRRQKPDPEANLRLFEELMEQARPRSLAPTGSPGRH